MALTSPHAAARAAYTFQVILEPTGCSATRHQPTGPPSPVQPTVPTSPHAAMGTAASTLQPTLEPIGHFQQVRQPLIGLASPPRPTAVIWSPSRARPSTPHLILGWAGISPARPVSRGAPLPHPLMAPASPPAREVV